MCSRSGPSNSSGDIASSGDGGVMGRAFRWISAAGCAISLLGLFS